MRRLMFVDDDADIRESFADLLEHAGWSVVHAADGLQALEWLAVNDPPAVILLDLKMPRCDGYEFRRRQLADPRLAAIPVIVFTADANLRDADRSALAGMSLVPKSVEWRELLALLGQK